MALLLSLLKAAMLLKALLLCSSLPSKMDQLTGLLGFSLPLSLRRRTLLGQLYCCLLPLLLLGCGCSCGCFCLLPPTELSRSGGGLLLGHSLCSCCSGSGGYQ